MRYKYFCYSCEKEFDYEHSINEILEKCPFCKKEKKITKIFKKFPGMQFNGEGFYVNDYERKNK